MGINKVKKCNSFNFGPSDRLGKSNDGRETANVGSQDEVASVASSVTKTSPDLAPSLLSCLVS